MGCGQSTDGQAWANSTKKVVSDFFLFVVFLFLHLSFGVVLLLKLKFFRKMKTSYVL